MGESPGWNKELRSPGLGTCAASRSPASAAGNPPLLSLLETVIGQGAGPDCFPVSRGDRGSLELRLEPVPPGGCADVGTGLLRAAWASLRFLRWQLPQRRPTSFNLAHLLATPTPPDAVQARLGFGDPLWAARTGPRDLGYSWMLLPFLPGPSECAGPWSPDFCDQD